MRIALRRGLTALALGALVLGSSPSLVAAQSRPDTPRAVREGRTARADRLDRLSERLNLTADQQTRARALFERQRTQAEVLRGGAGTPEQKRAAMRDLRQQTDRDFRALLTADQRARLDAARPDGRQRMQQRPGDRSGAERVRPDGARRGMASAAHLDRLTRALDLTAAQQTQVRALFERQRTEAQTLRDRTGTGSKREGMRALVTRTQSDLRALLTPEQRTKYDRLRTRPGAHKDGHRTREGAPHR